SSAPSLRFPLRLLALAPEERARRLGGRLLAPGGGELADELLLPVVQALRNLDGDLDDVVAAAVAVEPRDARALAHVHRPGLRARLNVELRASGHVVVECGDLDGAAERGDGVAHRDHRIHVRPVALEALVLGDVDVDEEIPRRAAPRRRFALSREAKPLA